MNLEQSFQQELIQKGEIAKKELGYQPTRFFQMIAAKGGVKTAKELISKQGIYGSYSVVVIEESNSEQTVFERDFNVFN